jgi:hypothetical protein
MLEEISTIFNEAIKTAVGVQAQIDFQIGNEIPSNEKIKFSGDTGGFLKISDPKATCFIGIAFPKATFLAILSNMLGEEFKELDPEFDETTLGFLEVAFGNATPILKQKGFAFEKGEIGTLRSFSFDKVKHDSIGSKVVEFTSDKGSFSFGVFISQK